MIDPPPFRIIKRITCFPEFFELFFETWAGYIIFFFSLQIIKSNCQIIFFNFSQIIFFWWIIYSFPVILIYKELNFCHCFRIFLFVHDLEWLHDLVMAYWKHLLFLLLTWSIAAFLIFIQWRESIYDPT